MIPYKSSRLYGMERGHSAGMPKPNPRDSLSGRDRGQIPGGQWARTTWQTTGEEKAAQTEKEPQRAAEGLLTSTAEY